jgi:hypothetical protein
VRLSTTTRLSANHNSAATAATGVSQGYLNPIAVEAFQAPDT